MLMCIILVVTVLGLNGHALLLSNGRVISGEVKALKDGHVYVESGKRTYEIPVVFVEKVWSEKDAIQLKEVIPYGDNYAIPNIVAKVSCRNTGVFESMSDREFEVYIVEKQLTGTKRISKTLWTIWGINVGVGIITGLIIANQ
jgi:F420-0:gamma-glutamyl ligase